MEPEDGHWLTLPNNDDDEVAHFTCDLFLDSDITGVDLLESNLSMPSDTSLSVDKDLSMPSDPFISAPSPSADEDIGHGGTAENGIDKQVDLFFAVESTPPRCDLAIEQKFNFSEKFDLELPTLSRSPSPCYPVRSPTPSPTLQEERKSEDFPRRFPFGGPPPPPQPVLQVTPLCVPVHPSEIQLAALQAMAGLPMLVPNLGGSLPLKPEKKKRRRACQTCHNRKVVCRSAYPSAPYPCIRCVKAGNGDKCGPNASKKRNRDAVARARAVYPPLYDSKTGKRIPRLADEFNINTGQCERDPDCGRPPKHPGHCRSKSALPRRKRRKSGGVRQG